MQTAPAVVAASRLSPFGNAAGVWQPGAAGAAAGSKTGPAREGEAKGPAMALPSFNRSMSFDR